MDRNANRLASKGHNDADIRGRDCGGRTHRNGVRFANRDAKSQAAYELEVAS